jgi:DNA polymerase-1
MRSFYYAWGHPTGNNCKLSEAKASLRRIWTSGTPLLFHNSKFDYEVALEHLGFPELPWDRIHDTLFLIFLQDPNRATLSLKPVAEKELGLPPNERDAVRAWLIEHDVDGAKTRSWGAHIAKAPGNLVGKYAVGDVDRTFKLFAKYYKEVIVDRAMGGAYDRERELMPELLRSERYGVRLDAARLAADVERYGVALDAADSWIRRRLKFPELNVDSNDDLAQRIQERGVADVTKWTLTESGKKSTAKDVLDEVLTDRALAGALAYRGLVSTCLRTFMTPWSATATRSGGLIYTSWNQVAQDYHESGARKGTRTGRLSSTPNFQNIPNNFDDKPIIVRALIAMNKNAELRRLLEKYPLPQVRGYIIPADGKILLNRDYSQQELRILAHYESGLLLDAYCADPWLDMHKFTQQIVVDILGIHVDRKPIKNLNFGLIYGMGIGKLAKSMGLDVDLSKQIKKAHRQGFPGISNLMKDMKQRAETHTPIRTWGGREYYCEEPKMIGGRMVEFDYKLINTLIQGSAADNTKQAMVNYARRKKELGLQGNLLINVHDELLHDAPIARRDVEMRALRDAMQDVKFDLPMLSTGGYGYRWTEINKLPQGE